MQLGTKFAWTAALTASMALSMAFAGENASKDEKIARAMSAAPERVSADATIMDVDGTVLREGSNGWTCLPSLIPGDDHPTCNDAVWMKFFKAMWNEEKFETDRVGTAYMLAGDMYVNNDDPTDQEKDPGETWVQEGPHIMVVFPDSKSLEDIPDDPGQGGPYVMWKDTPYAHVMIPVGPREK